MVFSILYLFLSVGLFMFFYKRTKDVLNPFSLSLGVFLFGAALSCLKLNPAQFDLAWMTHLCIITASAEIFIVGYLFTNRLNICLNSEHVYPQPRITTSYRAIKTIVVLVIFAGCVLIWLRYGSSIIAQMNQDGADMKVFVSDSLGLGRIGVYFANLLPYTVVFMFYELLFDKEKTKARRIFAIGYLLLAMLFIWFVLVSRGTMLIVILGVLYLLNVKYQFKVKHLACAFLAISVVFAVLLTLRVSNLQSFAYSGSSNNIYFNTIYNYVALNYQVFDMLVEHGSPFTFVSHSWISVSKFLGVYHPEQFIDLSIGPHNAKTFLYTFYHDLGYLGIVIYPTVIYTVIGYVYRKARTSKPHWILFLAVLQKPIAVVFFGNYFFGSFSIEVQFYLTMLILYFSYSNKQIKYPRIRIAKHRRY